MNRKCTPLLEVAAERRQKSCQQSPSTSTIRTVSVWTTIQNTGQTSYYQSMNTNMFSGTCIN